MTCHICKSGVWLKHHKFSLSVSFIQKNTYMYENAMSKITYVFFHKELFLLSGDTGSVDHHICLFLSSVIHALQKHFWHSSQFSLYGIRNVLSKSSPLLSWLSSLPSFDNISSNSHSLKYVSLCSTVTPKKNYTGLLTFLHFETRNVVRIGGKSLEHGIPKDIYRHVASYFVISIIIFTLLSKYQNCHQIFSQAVVLVLINFVFIITFRFEIALIR